ncbi:MAG: hypothetical protein J5643_07825 [Lachnospiraceae bacterium]|nr:hypothetical protein [Lachnospiraceae bacterium]
MTDKSKKYAYAAGTLFLLIFISSLYTYVLNLLYESKYAKKGVFEVLKDRFEDEYTRNANILSVASIAALLFLLIAMFSEKRGLFLWAVIVSVALFAFRNYYWVDYTSKNFKSWEWENPKTFAFIYSCVLTGVVLLMLLCMAIALLASSGMTGAFALVGYMFTGIITGIAIAIDIIPLFSDKFKTGEWTTNMSRFRATQMDGFVEVLIMDMLVILMCRWAALKREALVAAKNKTAPVDESQQPQVAAAPFFQATQAPTYQNSRPIYNTTIQPNQGVVPVPAAPAPAQAPAQPVTPPPAGTVFAAQVPQEAPKAEAPASVDAVKEALKASGPSAAEIEAAYDTISNTTDLSSEVSYTAETLSDDLAAKLAKLSEEAAKEVASGKEDDLSDALERIGEKAEKAADDTADTAEDAVETVEDTVEEAADAVEETVEEVAKNVEEAASEAAEDAAEKVEEAVEDVAEKVEDTVSEAAESAVESAESLAEDVIKNE